MILPVIHLNVLVNNYGSTAINKVSRSNIAAVNPCKSAASEFEFSGKLAVEQRHFVKKGTNAEQLQNSQTSIMVEPELYWSWKRRK